MTIHSPPLLVLLTAAIICCNSHAEAQNAPPRAQQGTTTEKAAPDAPVQTAPAAPASATIHVVWPCGLMDFVMPDSVKYGYPILVDGKMRGRIKTCAYTKFSVAPGSRGIRLEVPMFELLGVDQRYKLSAGSNVYFTIFTTYGGVPHLKNVSSADGKAIIAGVKNF